MPDKLVTRGLVLRATETKEADYILNVLTAEHGRLAVIARGARDFIGFFTLGTQEEDLWMGIKGDNSMNMLILGIFAIILLCFLILLWVCNIRDAAFTARQVEKGKKPRSFPETLAALADERFHIAALCLPLVTVMIFSVLPIIFMILIAFTNLGGDIVYPKLADWSFSAWKKIFSVGKLGSTFGKILTWNVLWAVITTAINFLCGLGLALLLNKKNVRGSKIWRAFPILAYAIPGFISMLGFKFMFSQSGPINSLLAAAGKDTIFFLTNDASAKWWARGIGLFVNAWISVPSIMLMTTGILTNINHDLYEASSLDGATPFQQFRKITLPFVVFSTTPVLIGQFGGNLDLCQVLGDVGGAVDQGSFQDLLGYHLVFRRYDQEIRHQLQRFVLVAGNAHHGLPCSQEALGAQCCCGGV